MEIVLFFYNNGLWLSPPLFGLGGYLLYCFIVKAVRLGAKYRICGIPLAAEQSIEFAEAGQVDLWMEGPQFSTRFRGLSYELVGPDGSTNTGRMILLRTHSSGFSKARLAIRTFTIAYPGRYILHTRGLGEPRAGDEKHGLIFMRPHILQSFGCVLGILLGAWLTIGSLVNFFLRLFQVAE
jgi:hypothetical protein